MNNFRICKAYVVWTICAVIAVLCLHKAPAIQCVQCASESDSLCAIFPPPPLQCNSSEMHSCIILEEISQGGEMMRLTRTCSPADIVHEECENGMTNGGVAVVVCHRTCNTDGCNSTPTDGLVAHILGICAFIVLWLND